MAPSDRADIAVLVGSLRAESWNRRLATLATEAAGDRADLRMLDLSEVPPYNADHDDPPPPAVETLRKQITAADGLLVFTPTYNHGIPGLLKNAIDWASRPAFAGCLVGVPVAVTGATTGRGDPTGGISATRDALEICLAEVMAPAEPGFRSIAHRHGSPEDWENRVVVPLTDLMERYLEFVDGVAMARESA